MAREIKRVMVFGVFDLLHPGHLYALYHARLRGDELVAVVARDVIVKGRKGKVPTWSERRRARIVKETGLATKVVLGDKKEGKYGVIRKYNPNIICLGYDQTALKKDLAARIKDNQLPTITLYTLKPYRPDLFHTSLRRNHP